MKLKESKIAIWGLIIGLLFLWTHLAELRGVLKERERKICVTPYEIDRMDSLIKLAEGVYLNPKNEIKEILDAALEEKELWRDKYYSLIRSNQEAQKTEDLKNNEKKDGS